MRLLLINPWIHDFAAYDFWARPLGLQIVAGILRQTGAEVEYLDLTDPLSPWLPDDKKRKRRTGGHGKFNRTRIVKPSCLPDINRHFSRYGIPPEFTRRALAAQQKPDAVLVTSMMTYWYTGVVETIETVKEQWPDVPVILGGVYATLCDDHARRVSGADHVVTGAVEDAAAEVSHLLGLSIDDDAIDKALPLFQPHGSIDSAGLLTSRGCPFDCPYCGVKQLHPRWVKYAPERIEREVRHVVLELGISDLALLDDAFLIDTDRAIDIMQRIAVMASTLCIHAASGLSCRGLTADAAYWMKKSGFATIRLGLETADPKAQQKMGGKVDLDEFKQAVQNLLAAGFSKSDIGVYVMAGMPGQARAEVEQSVDEVLALGLQPHLSEYSPVPGSPMFALAQEASKYDLAEPLLHNPTLLPCDGEDLDAHEIQKIKHRISLALGDM